jgi:type II secretory pathway pseudopilin PulG
MRRRLASTVRDERGFTVFELLVVLVILVTVIGAILTAFTSALGSEVDLSARVRAQEQARLALDTLRRDVHCASETSGLTVDVPSSRVTFLLPFGCPSVVTEYVTWCTRTTGAASRFTVYRNAHAVNDPAVDYCAEPGGVTWADFVTNAEVFTYSHPDERRAQVSVDLLVDVDPASPSRAFALRDALVLRNSDR